MAAHFGFERSMDTVSADVCCLEPRSVKKKQFSISSESVLTPVGFGSVSLAQDFRHTENHRTIKKPRRYE
jgi:hypothetical protein